MVFTIVGAVFAFIQMCVAAAGADYVRDVFGEYFQYGCDYCEQVFVENLYYYARNRYDKL